MLLGLFEHTADGEKALGDVLGAGVAAAEVCVVGDLGVAAGEPGAMRHVTLDALHVPGEQRARFMDGVRGGGVVLAVRGEGVGVEEILKRRGASLVETTSEVGSNPSHNDA